MKLIVTIALILSVTACGKKSDKNTVELPHYEVNPYTGEVDVLRARVSVPVVVNQAYRTVTFLETRTDTPVVTRATFTCSLAAYQGNGFQFNIAADGRTLMVSGPRGTETYYRNWNSYGLLGQWEKRDFVNGIKYVTKLRFDDYNYAHYTLECSRRY